MVLEPALYRALCAASAVWVGLCGQMLAKRWVEKNRTERRVKKVKANILCTEPLSTSLRERMVGWHI